MLKYYDLQLFSEEKTEQPTAKKIRDTREKGQVPQSKDLNGAFSLLAVFAALSFLSDFYVDEIFGFYHFIMNLTEDPIFLYSSQGINQLLQEVLLTILKLSLPPLVVAMIVGVLLSYMQVGVLFTIEPIKPKLNKINPLKGFKNMFSTRSLVELLKSLFKAGLILYVSWTFITSRISEILLTMELETGQIVLIMWDLVFGVVIRSALILFVIAVFDFAFKKWKNKKDIMMTKQEIKDEYKQSEGDPQLKAKIKEKQRAFAMSRMMQEVPKADVVITNPTHYAIAVQYDSNLGDAPRVVAKGQDLVAQNIKRVATENEVPLVENKPLAQGLYKAVDIGDFIPPDFYEAVAEVLAYVYTLKRNA
ncbi:flagellar biosynthesis protein FlhB [Fusibacter tunisiensis]|jgi:flagellar biosynthetic protein FlhB|uniref:Flagellar biosynthetic protein FlhB n=1 Tax=Fusibacter tunisiensis TaxID=1008308 RepID=A0ABS2MMH9_9FIRM|nr:flagellar biosynthesis protein FlhB [Fusibacter tunisiensis]MBM7560601.1 flagellar biosynthetic protein FlhB [Fusibacter tunisiensis]